ncbi:hypothetical protein, partial [Rhodovulum marinum]|uniref:hypothetical protein n=1 Tax=Rhodovulum marinum TaxID=320662 RepID=UPI001A9D10C4
MQTSIRRMDQTAHISLQIPAMSKSVETKTRLVRHFYLAPPASFRLWFFGNRPDHPARPAPRQRLSAAGEGVFTDHIPESQALFATSSQFFC